MLSSLTPFKYILHNSGDLEDPHGAWWAPWRLKSVGDNWVTDTFTFIDISCNMRVGSVF